MQTRSKTRTASNHGSSTATNTKGRARSPSPDWEINSQDFEGSPVREGEPEKEASPFVPTHSQSPSRSVSPNADLEGSEPDTDAATHHVGRDVQSQNARSPPWLAWQDRSLIQEVDRLRPFNAPRGDAAKNAWDTLAVELRKNRNANGSVINRTGAACRARFQKLVKAHKADQTRSLQKTGTDEEVDEHIELLSQVVELVDARELQKGEKSAASQTSDDDLKPKRKRGRNQLVEIVKHRNATDAKRLEKARKLDEQRHTEMQQLQQRSINLQENLVTGFGKLAEGINTLVQAQATLAAAEANRVEMDNRCRHEESERRRDDAERRAAEAERYASLLQALATHYSSSTSSNSCSGPPVKYSASVGGLQRKYCGICGWWRMSRNGNCCVTSLKRHSTGSRQRLIAELNMDCSGVTAAPLYGERTWAETE
ncbi:hypothetical protein B0H19DRAFT_1349307 [Mycena capillaripes]|nr:hypothetical protein B0H19DRAFT_1349307 [Mycena capillaripes]